MSRPNAEEGARARRARRQERRLTHFRALAFAAAQTQASADAAGVERMGELEVNPFEEAARHVIAEHEAGRLTAADLESLGIREDDSGGIWIRIGAWGQG